MSNNDSLTILAVFTGIVGSVTGIVSLAIHFLRDRARVKVALLKATHSNDGGLGLLSVQFKIDNIGNYPTSITSLEAWVLDGTRKLTGKLESLRDQQTATALTKSYRVDAPPPLETLLSQHMSGHSSEIYYATFRFLEGEIQSAKEVPFELTIVHTHGTERIEGLSKPSMFQRVVGTQNP